jgi:bifunctional non-homologous end joining protein LigD
MQLVPADLAPMLPVLVDALPTGPGWLFELKWDGVRVLALRVGGRGELWSRRGRRVTRQYPEIAAAVAALPGGDVALDGEIVALDDAGRPSFERLQRRMHLERDVAGVAAAVPATAYFYDCLVHAGRDVRRLPLVERKELLRALIPAPGTIRYAEHVDDGPGFLAAVRAAGLEGVIAKRADGPYRAGRHAEWRKIKCHRRQEFVIGGWTDPKGTRAHLGAVHVGFYEADELVYAGRAGSGLGDDHLADLFARLRALATERCPFTRGATPRGPEHHWARPELVCEVRFTEWTTDGLLRQPVYVGLRDDRAAPTVFREHSRGS